MHQSAQRQLHDLNYLFFEITRRCNLACRHCGSDCAADVSQPDLPADSILAVLDGIRQRHDPARITVALTGGEPLLQPGFFELGTAITARGYPWGMVSNGWAWTPARVEAARLAESIVGHPLPGSVKGGGSLKALREGVARARAA